MSLRNGHDIALGSGPHSIRPYLQPAACVKGGGGNGGGGQMGKVLYGSNDVHIRTRFPDHVCMQQQLSSDPLRVVTRVPHDM